MVSSTSRSTKENTADFDFMEQPHSACIASKLFDLIGVNVVDGHTPDDFHSVVASRIC